MLIIIYLLLFLFMNPIGVFDSFWLTTIRHLAPTSINNNNNGDENRNSRVNTTTMVVGSVVVIIIVALY